MTSPLFQNLDVVIERARRNQDAQTAFLALLRSDTALRASRRIKDPEITDEDVIEVVRATMGGIDETLAKLPEDHPRRPELAAQRDICVGLIPQPLTPSELEALVRREATAMGQSLPLEGKAYGMVLRACKQAYPNRVDAKLFGEIATKA